MVFALDRAVFGPCVFISFMDVHHSDHTMPQGGISHWPLEFLHGLCVLSLGWRLVKLVAYSGTSFITLVTLTSRHLFRSSEWHSDQQHIGIRVLTCFDPSISREQGMDGIQTGCDIMAWRTAKLRTCWKWHILSSVSVKLLNKPQGRTYVASFKLPYSYPGVEYVRCSAMFWEVLN